MEDSRYAQKISTFSQETNIVLQKKIILKKIKEKLAINVAWAFLLWV